MPSILGVGVEPPIDKQDVHYTNATSKQVACFTCVMYQPGAGPAVGTCSVVTPPPIYADGVCDIWEGHSGDS